MVVACLAATIGCMVGTWDVEKTAMRRVSAASPAAHVYVSNEAALKLVAPPKPFQRATGTSASMPARSARIAISRVAAHVASGLRSARVAEQPPPRFEPKTPSFRRFGP